MANSIMGLINVNRLNVTVLLFALINFIGINFSDIKHYKKTKAESNIIYFQLFLLFIFPIMANSIMGLINVKRLNASE